MNRLFATTALITALALGPAMAQQSGGQPEGNNQALQKQDAPQQSKQMTEKKDQGQQAATAQAGNVEFLTSQQPSDWLASSLIGRTVYNMQEEELGDINDVILGEDGKVVAVVIGMGGFLGIGEKDVGVKFSALQFRSKLQLQGQQPEERKQAAARQPTEQGEKDRTTTATRKPAESDQNAGEQVAVSGEKSFTLEDTSGEVQGKVEVEVKGETQVTVQKDQDQAAGDRKQAQSESSKEMQQQEMQKQQQASQAEQQKDQTQAAREETSRPEGEMSDRDRPQMAASQDAEHSEIMIVLAATKEQLEAAPAFAYLDEQEGTAQRQPQARPAEQEGASRDQMQKSN